MPRDKQPLDVKLEQFDRHADHAVDEILVWLRGHRRDLIAVARGRHVEGHYRYQEAGLAHDENHLLAEAAQELADAIVYLARRAAIRSA